MKTYYVLPDNEIPGFIRNPLIRTTFTPGTVSLYEQPLAGRSITVELSKYAQDLVKRIQRTPQAWRYIQRSGIGWVNVPNQFPKVRCVAMIKGYLCGEQYNKEWVKIQTLTPTNSFGLSWYDSRYIHRFYLINKKGKVIDGKPGGVYIIIYSPQGFMYIPAWRVREA